MFTLASSKVFTKLPCNVAELAVDVDVVVDVMEPELIATYVDEQDSR
jgi:hypothetical protein